MTIRARLSEFHQAETGFAGLVAAAGFRGELSRRLTTWVIAHKGELFWGLLFAWVMARFVFPPPHDPYYVDLIERSTSAGVTEEQFHHPNARWMVGDVQVRLRVVNLQKTDPDQEKEEAKQKAKELAAAKDTLMVIGDLTTGVTRQSEKLRELLRLTMD